MVLLTGATGFVGRRIARELHARGTRLRLLLRRIPLPPYLADLPAEAIQGDVLRPDTLAGALSGVDAVIHLAAIIREQGGATFDQVNYRGTANLLEASRKAGVKAFLYMSNLGAGPDPRYPFLYSKWKAEEAVKASGIPYTIFRSSLMFGPGGGISGVLAGMVRLTPIVPIPGSGRTLFQPVSLEEVARCLAIALEDASFRGRTVELAGPEHLTYDQMVDQVARAMGKRRLKLHIPLGLMRPLVWAMERLLPNPPVTSHQLAMLSTPNTTALDAIEKTFGFQPTPLREGLGFLKGQRSARKGLANERKAWLVARLLFRVRELGYLNKDAIT